MQAHIIYFSLIIPVLAVIITSWKFPKKVTLLERALILIIPVIVIFVAKHVSVASLTADTEYWNSYIVKAEYYEYWNEWIQETCCASRDSSGNCTSEYDCSYEEEH